MIGVLDMRGDLSAWDKLVAQIICDCAGCPDAERRVEAFAAAARADLAGGGEAYLVLEPVAENGVAVMRARPGPEAEKFLREMLEGRRP